METKTNQSKAAKPAVITTVLLIALIPLIGTGGADPVSDVQETVTDTLCSVDETAPLPLPTPCPSQLPRWVSLYDSVPGGESRDKIRWGQTADVSGDGTRVFVTGESWAIGDGGSGYDYATLAYDAETGDELWVARYNGPGEDHTIGDSPLSLDVSPDDASVYVTGYSWGDGTTTDYATVAYDAETGDELWAARYAAGTRADIAVALQVSPDGATVYVTGRSGDDSNLPDYATVAYDAETGDELWVARYEGPLDRQGQPNDLVVSPDGSSVFVVGLSVETTSWSYDLVTVAYDADTGQEQWVARSPRTGSTTNCCGHPFAAIDPDGSTVYVASYRMSDGGTSQQEHTNRVSVAYDADTGDELWVAEYDGQTGNGFDGLVALDVSPDGSTVYTTGTSVTTATSYDYATVANDAETGQQLWASRYNGPGSGQDFAYAMGLSGDGSHVYVTGTSGNPSPGQGGWGMVTTAYDAQTGTEAWVHRHDGLGDCNGSGNSYDVPWTLAVSDTSLYIAGEGTSLDGPVTDCSPSFQTVAYDIGSGQSG